MRTVFQDAQYFYNHFEAGEIVCGDSGSTDSRGNSPATGRVYKVVRTIPPVTVKTENTAPAFYTEGFVETIITPACVEVEDQEDTILAHTLAPLKEYILNRIDRSGSEEYSQRERQRGERLKETARRLYNYEG